MLTSSKRAKLHQAIKAYSKKYLTGKSFELDESGTRLMINSFLTDVLSFAPIEEVKTEYMIKGTYADYVVQVKGVRRFLVEVKALSFKLSEKHLRQTINYGANEGIEWAMLTNGKSFDFYKILFTKPIESRKIFSIDLSDPTQINDFVNLIQYIHRDSIANKGLNILWNKTCALDPLNLAGILYAPQVSNFLKKTLNRKFRTKFNDDEILASLNRVIREPMVLEDIKTTRFSKSKRKPKGKPVENTLSVLEPGQTEENS